LCKAGSQKEKSEKENASSFYHFRSQLFVFLGPAFPGQVILANRVLAISTVHQEANTRSIVIQPRPCCLPIFFMFFSKTKQRKRQPYNYIHPHCETS
jgi:hypothetical protein